ncbi:ankyrin repeat-containing domain protein [Aspergillus novoparasiticus]|uniref:Ankyrin repeat-containing domain protein n=1 Tax=Aspergillus novoparasiticus TaxID=986946 RepID=A0A5N6F2H6_9EURO|nr:ankyrin repeat-containing domain protein [Aspergillus novoparasiticus]
MVDDEEKAHRGQRPTLNIPEESTLAPSISMDITQNQNTVTGRKLRQRGRIIHYLSPAWIEQEALSLLQTIKQDVTHGKYDKGASIVLSGFGFSGIVVKRAVNIANTTPEYYDVALRIYSLVMCKLGRFGNELGEVVEWQDEDFNSLAWCNVGDLPKLKALRTQLAPAHLLNSETIDHSLLLGKCEVTDAKKRTDISHIIDTQDGKRQTPLMMASQMGHIDCARHLIEPGADISIKDATGKTVVHYAVLNCPEIIKYVAGQDSMYSIDNEGCTPLHIAAKYGSVEATSILLSVLLRSEKPTQTIKALDNAKKTALTHAAEQGHTEVVEILLERQGHAVTYDEYHAGELYAAELAAADGHLVTLRVLIEYHFEKRMIKDAILGDHLLKEC